MQYRFVIIGYTSSCEIHIEEKETHVRFCALNFTQLGAFLLSREDKKMRKKWKKIRKKKDTKTDG